MYTEDDIQNARLAGFFDGEGSVRIEPHRGKGGSLSYHLSIQVGQSALNPAPLEEFKRSYGGTIHGPTKKDKMLYWEASGEEASTALTKMFRYLMVKDAVAQLGLAFQFRKDECPRTRRGIVATSSFLEMADMFYKVMRYLNSNKKAQYLKSNQGVAPILVGSAG